MNRAATLRALGRGTKETNVELTKERYEALVDALDQYVANCEDAEDLGEACPHLETAREMLDELNAKRAALAVA